MIQPLSKVRPRRTKTRSNSRVFDSYFSGTLYIVPRFSEDEEDVQRPFDNYIRFFLRLASSNLSGRVV